MNGLVIGRFRNRITLVGSRKLVNLGSDGFGCSIALGGRESIAVWQADVTGLRTIIGLIQWIAMSRADIQYASKELARRMSRSRWIDFAKAKKVGRYLLHTRGYELRLWLEDGEIKEVLVITDAALANTEA